MRFLTRKFGIRIKKRNRIKQAEQYLKGNVLNQNFKQAQRPDDIWLSDFTHLQWLLSSL
ncbi:hypothetical protein KAR50_05285 [Periweissella fabaria]|uniref:hypothetical protein n=1 Tax=Periweissella fabaria TaxID=546157 RepID=UPI001E5A05B4|nr:hypothetical protein [Periweissella fabaria]MCM0597253.1 hypothetical protein [Periweissella fabaria]